MIRTGTFLQQRYRIDKQIGQGGMGAVYVAKDERFGSTVAIKETLCMDDNFRKALEREARLLNSLKHSALPRVSDHFLEDEGQFLVMEFVPGMDLMQTLDSRSEPFPFSQVLNWADQLLDALEYLHNQENPVVHRDIKPQNLKVTAKGQVVLLDFGLAKGNVTDAGNLTAAKSIFGYSRNYASLEQIQGTGTDPRSDLYSLAATLYHLMTGLPPEDALTRAMAVLSHQPDPLLPASTVNPHIRPGISFVVQNAMDLSAGRRPASAAELRERLQFHEKFANETSPGFTAPNLTEPTILGASTIGNQESTIAAVAGNEAVTQLLPENISKITSVRDAMSNGERVGFADFGNGPSATRRFKYGFAGVIAVLAISAVSAGIHFSRFDMLQEPVQQGDVPAVEIQQAVPQQAANVSATDTEASVEGFSNTQPSASGSTSTVVNQAERRNGRRQSATDPEIPSVPDAGEVGADSDRGIIDSGNVRVQNGRVATPNLDFNFNRQLPNIRMPQFPVDPRKLTPEQRRKLRRLRQQHPEIFVIPTPTPPN